ncbi:MAG TPA: DNA-3-methyladenine glycosylase [Streptosporangiaceae bacterium]
MEPLAREFFERPSTEVAPELLGCVFWHDSRADTASPAGHDGPADPASPAGLVAVRLVEVEAYQGAFDPASHAFRGQTARNAVMFGLPGHVYVYFTYGMHFCVNIVCQPAGQAEAVLLRAGEVICGVDLATSRRARERGRPVRPRDLARGPARLCQALDIDRGLDGTDLCAVGSPLGIGPPVSAGMSATGPRSGAAVPGARPAVMSGPRVGVSEAADRPWRYWLAGDGHVSLYRPWVPRAPRQKPVAGRDGGDGTMHP